MLRRSDTERFGAGLWEVLQGSRDEAETFLIAVRRELREELSIDDATIDACGQIVIVSDDQFMIAHRSKRHNEDWSNVNYLWIGADLQERLEFRIDPKYHSQAQWVSVDQARELLGEHGFSEGGRQLLDDLPFIRARLLHAADLLRVFDTQEG